MGDIKSYLKLLAEHKYSKLLFMQAVKTHAVIQPLVLLQYFHKVQHLMFRSEARHKQLQCLKKTYS